MPIFHLLFSEKLQLDATSLQEVPLCASRREGRQSNSLADVVAR